MKSSQWEDFRAFQGDCSSKYYEGDFRGGLEPRLFCDLPLAKLFREGFDCITVF